MIVNNFLHCLMAWSRGNSSSNTSNCDIIGHENLICSLAFSLKTISSTFTILGCSFLLLYMAFYKLYKHPNQRILIYLIVNALLMGICFGIGYWYAVGTWCTIQGVLLQFLGSMLMYWFVIITINLYINIIFFKPTSFCLEILFLCLSPIQPIISSIIPIIYHAYGPVGVWCWISINPSRGLEETGNILRWVLFYGLITIVIVSITIAYIVLILIMLYKTDKLTCGKVRTRSYSLGEVKKIGILKDIFEHSSSSFLAFPIVCIIVYFFPVLNRFLEIFFPRNTFDWLFLLQAFVSPLVGFMLAFAYMFDKTFWKNLKYSSIRDQWITWRYKTVVSEYPTN